MKRILAVLVLILLLSPVLFPRPEPVMGWGLSFPQEGQPPAAPQPAAKLRELGGAYVDEDGGKVLYLTFDLGYENGYTAQILDVLKELEIPAAFFVTGDYLDQAADLVRRMTAEGHIVGNHTESHPDMTKLDGDAFRAELTAMEEKYSAVTEQTLPKFFRPPQGVYDENTLRQAREMGYQTVFWSLAYADWDNDRQPSPDEAVEKLNRRIHDGAVVLLHGTSKTNAEILHRLLSGWRDMGYRFAPVTELFR